MNVIKHIEAFYNWYMPQRIANSTWDGFTKLPFNYRLGYYLAFIHSEGFDLVIGNGYYAITRNKKPLDVQPEADTNFDDLMHVIVNTCFTLIDNPF